MHIAFCFFGITRSLKYTIDSIKQNIFGEWDNSDYTIFLHTYNLNNYHNIRTREKSNNVNNNEYKLLKPDYFEIDDQDEIKKKINMTLYRTHKDPWNTNYNSVDNFILAQYSKSRLVNMIAKTNNNYDYIIFLRPDCMYFDKLSINLFSRVNDNSISIPNWHLYGPYKFNDRFCITNMKTYKIYGDVFKDLLDISKKSILHSETVLGNIIYKEKLNVNRTNFKFSRIRMNGLRNKLDFPNLKFKIFVKTIL